MPYFEFETQGIEVGFDANGFRAFGQTDSYKWKDDDYDPSGRGIPGIKRETIYWCFDTNPQTQMQQYIDRIELIQALSAGPVTTANPTGVSSLETEVPVANNDLENHIRRYGDPLGRIQREEHEDGRIQVIFSLPNDPSFVAFMIGMFSTENDMRVYCGHYNHVSAHSAGDVFDRWLQPYFFNSFPIIRQK